MICAFSPSSVSGCDSLAIKHAVSGLCCVWVFGSSGLPWPLLRGRGIWWAGPVQGSGRLPGPHQPLASAGEGTRPTLECQGGTCGYAWTATTPCSHTAAAPLLPGAPAHCGHCDTDTTALGHGDKEQEDLTLSPLMPHRGETSAQSGRVTLPLPPTATAAPQMDRRHEAHARCKPLPSPRQKAPEQTAPASLLLTVGKLALSHPSYYLVLNTIVQGKEKHSC